MLLIFRELARHPSLLTLFLVPLSLSACAVRMDGEHAKGTTVSGRGMRTVGACGQSGMNVIENAPAPAQHSFLGFRRDLRPDPYRTARAAHLSADPRETPTPGELRAARALALAELEIVQSGGNIMYRSDGSSSQPRSVDFVASANALTLDYAASDNLNCIDGGPHALLLVVYHLSDRAALDQLAGHEAGMVKLLEGGYFDESVKGVRTHVVQPGNSGTLILDRPDKGKYVAIVAGYAEPDKRTSLYVGEYGVGEWISPGETPFHRGKRMYMPLPLHLAADLDRLDMTVRSTGRVYGSMQKVSHLLARQTRHLTVRQAFGR